MNKNKLLKSTFLILIVAILLSLAWYVNTGNFNLSNENQEIKITQGVKHAIALEDIVERGPAKDDIPSLDKPKFTQIAEADQFLEDSEAIIGVIGQDQIKAYPLQILRWHEIVNDQIDQQPIAITFSPLTGTTNVFSRKIKHRTVNFGVSGKLYNNNTLIYDRTSTTLWAQLSGTAVVGELTGTVLTRIPSFVFSWGKWKTLYPESLVLSRDTGYLRSYNINPYYNYDTSESVYFPLTYEDKRIFSKQIIYGLEDSGKTQAFAQEKIIKDKVINSEIGDLKFVLIWDEGAEIVRAYSRVLKDGSEIRLEKRDKYFDNNNLEWNLLGEGVAKENQGKTLTPIMPTRTFWFAWTAFYPDTEIII